MTERLIDYIKMKYKYFKSVRATALFMYLLLYDVQNPLLPSFFMPVGGNADVPYSVDSVSNH